MSTIINKERLIGKYCKFLLYNGTFTSGIVIKYDPIFNKYLLKMGSSIWSIVNPVKIFSKDNLDVKSTSANEEQKARSKNSTKKTNEEQQTRSKNSTKKTNEEQKAGSKNSTKKTNEEQKARSKNSTKKMNEEQQTRSKNSTKKTNEEQQTRSKNSTKKTKK